MFFPLFVAGIVFYKMKFQEINAYRCLLLAFCFTTQIILFDDAGRNIFITKLQYIAMLTLYFVAFFLYVIGYLHFIVNKVTLFLGKISYSVYLIHNAIGTLLITILTSSHLIRINFWIVLFFIVLPLVLFTATMVNKYIEVPAMAYIKNRQRKTTVAG
jgi:peptidoglycan/LPS O-acetylase OafA/YrhL